MWCEASISQVYKLKDLKDGYRQGSRCAVWDRQTPISVRFNTLSSKIFWRMFNIQLNSCSSFTTPGLWNMTHCKHHLLFVMKGAARFEWCCCCGGVPPIIFTLEYEHDLSLFFSLSPWQMGKARLNPIGVNLLSPCMPPPWLSMEGSLAIN